MKALFGMILVLFRGSQQNPSHLFQIGVLHLHTKIPLTLPFSPLSLPPFSLSLSSSFSSQIFLLSSDRMKAPPHAHTHWLFRPGRTHVRACVCWPISFVVVSVDKHEVEAAAAAEEKKIHTTHSLSLPPSLSLSHTWRKEERASNIYLRVYHVAFSSSMAAARVLISRSLLLFISLSISRNHQQTCRDLRSPEEMRQIDY